MRGLLRAAFAAVALAAAAVTARAEDVVLETGEVLKGTVVERTAEHIVLDHPVLGRLTILSRNLAAPPGQDGLKEAVEKVAADPPKPVNPWKMHLGLGLNGTLGNSRTKDWTVGATAERETPDSKVKLDTSYVLGEAGGVTTKNFFTLGGRKEWILAASRWSPFGQARYDRDEFTPWTQRASVGGGAGYRMIDGGDLTLTGRLGGAGTKEWGSGDDSDHVRPEGLAGLDLAWKISDRQSLSASATYYPDLSAPEFRAVGTIAWTMKMDAKGGVSLRAQVDEEYDTHRKDPFHRTDIRYALLLLFEF